jgi:hypothetical protein
MGDINNSLCRMEIARVRTVSTCMANIPQFLISVVHKRVVFGHYLRIMMDCSVCVVFYVCCVWVFQRLRDARRGTVRRARAARAARESLTRAHARTRVFVGACRTARERGERVRRGCEVRVGRSNTIRDF